MSKLSKPVSHSIFFVPYTLIFIQKARYLKSMYIKSFIKVSVFFVIPFLGFDVKEIIKNFL